MLNVLNIVQTKDWIQVFMILSVDLKYWLFNCSKQEKHTLWYRWVGRSVNVRNYLFKHFGGENNERRERFRSEQCCGVSAWVAWYSQCICVILVCVCVCARACMCVYGMMSFHLCQSCSWKKSSWNDNCRSASLRRCADYFSMMMLRNCVELSVNFGLVVLVCCHLSMKPTLFSLSYKQGAK